MIRKLFLVLLLLLFFSNAASQQVDEKPVIKARITVIGGEVKVDEIRVVLSGSKSEPGDEYIAKVLDRGMETLYQTRFSFREMVVKMPKTIPKERVPDYYDEVEGRLEAHLFFPYFREAAILAVGKEGEKPIAFIDLRERLCNNDGICSESENYLSCKEDCPLWESDNYCYPETDGICDPDCVEGLDMDCGLEEENGGNGTGGLLPTEYYFIGAVALIALVIVVYNLAKRKRK